MKKYILIGFLFMGIISTGASAQNMNTDRKEKKMDKKQEK